MRFTVRREELIKALQTLSGVVEKKQTMQILSNVLLKIEDQKGTMTATDAETEIITNVNVDVEQGGVITLPLKKLLDSSRTLNDGAIISLEIKKEKAEVKSGKTRFSLATLPASEFPISDGKAILFSFKVKERDLKELIEKTYFAMAVQDVRYFLNGMYWEIDGKDFRTVATDGHRLALANLEIGNESKNKLGIIIPRKAILELVKLIQDSENDVVVEIGENSIRVKTDNVIFTTKLIDGSYPNYQSVIPNAGEKVLVAEKEELKDCLNRTSVLSSEKYRGIKIEVKEGKLKAVANNPEHEEAEDEVEVEYTGETIEAGFNVAYLLDAVNGIRGKKVKILFSNVNNSAIIKEQVGDNTLYVVMPMRL